MIEETERWGVMFGRIKSVRQRRLCDDAGDVGEIKIDLGAPEEIMRWCDGGDD